MGGPTDPPKSGPGIVSKVLMWDVNVPRMGFRKLNHNFSLQKISEIRKTNLETFFNGFELTIQSRLLGAFSYSLLKCFKLRLRSIIWSVYKKSTMGILLVSIDLPMQRIFLFG